MNVVHRIFFILISSIVLAIGVVLFVIQMVIVKPIRFVVFNKPYTIDASMNTNALTIVICKVEEYYEEHFEK